MYNKGKSRLKEIEQALSDLHTEVHGGSSSTRILQSYFTSASKAQSHNKSRIVVGTTQASKKKTAPKTTLLATVSSTASTSTEQAPSCARSRHHEGTQVAADSRLQVTFQCGDEDIQDAESAPNEFSKESDESPGAPKCQTGNAIDGTGTHIEVCVQEGIELYTKLCDAIQDYHEVDTNDLEAYEGEQGPAHSIPDAPSTWGLISAGRRPSRGSACGDAAWLEQCARVISEITEGPTSASEGDNPYDEDPSTSIVKEEEEEGGASGPSASFNPKEQRYSNPPCTVSSIRGWKKPGPSIVLAREGTAVAASQAEAFAKRLQREAAAARQRRQGVETPPLVDADPPRLRRAKAPEPSVVIKRPAGVLFCPRCHRGFELDVSRWVGREEGGDETTPCPHCSATVKVSEGLGRRPPSSAKQTSTVKAPMCGVGCGGDDEANDGAETSSAKTMGVHKVVLSEAVGTDLTQAWSEDLKGLYFLHLWDEAAHLQV
ncbi:unnamed protein product [Phytomonas sp. EM1]|nr:unnamed protein product [Phytomonas sp. EM1]|eukprot:CCW65487.1 unnamed protein product [Phytomonas sp. isolate EM1]